LPIISRIGLKLPSDFKDAVMWLTISIYYSKMIFNYYSHCVS
jgi:hypothetical protein